MDTEHPDRSLILSATAELLESWLLWRLLLCILPTPGYIFIIMALRTAIWYEAACATSIIRRVKFCWARCMCQDHGSQWNTLRRGGDVYSDPQYL